MKYKPGDKVWVTRTSLEGCKSFPLNLPQGGVVLGLDGIRSRRYSAIIYSVDVPGCPTPNNLGFWHCTENTLTPRDDPQTFDEPKLSTANPDKVSVWGAGGTWLPEEIKASYRKWFTQLR
jgi:hypothetical protein